MVAAAGATGDTEAEVEAVCLATVVTVQVVTEGMGGMEGMEGAEMIQSGVATIGSKNITAVSTTASTAATNLIMKRDGMNRTPAARMLRIPRSPLDPGTTIEIVGGNLRPNPRTIPITAGVAVTSTATSTGLVIRRATIPRTLTGTTGVETP